MEVARHISFIGHVQGVGFRYTARRIAQSLGLKGFVRNVPDGTVEMFVQGPPDLVDECLKAIGQEFAGYIHQQQVRPTNPDPSYKDFQIAF
ncbi:MAG: acylphosphatase [Sedimentisphaerales bacterium]|jgi:acylphosphatase|nr:acylphosphatase [Sedimentisphaerales bacterium]